MAARVGVGDVVVMVGAAYYQGVVVEEIKQNWGRGKIESGFVVHTQDTRHPDEPWTYREGPKTAWRRRAPIPNVGRRREGISEKMDEAMMAMDAILGLLGREL
jgi:hypothetical protein